MITDLVRMEDGQASIDWQRLLQTPLDDLESEEVLAALSLVDVTAKALAQRAKELKPKASEIVMAMGEKKTEKTFRVAGGATGLAVEVTKKGDTLKVDEAALRTVLKEVGIPEEDIFDRLPVLNDKKLETAIVQGRVTEEHVARFTSKRPSAPAVSVKEAPFGITKAKLLGHG